MNFFVENLRKIYQIFTKIFRKIIELNQENILQVFTFNIIL